MKSFLNVKLMLFLLLSSMICFVGCNQANNKGKDNTNQTEAKHIVITLTGDEHVAEGKNVTFKVAKDSKWETVKSHEKIKAVKFADNYELDKWKQDNATGTDLADTYVFATDKTIYAVSKTKNVPSTDITITIQGDEHVTEGKNVTFKVAKDSKWETVKSHEKIKAVKFADNYELDVWKQDNATGTDLSDAYVFVADKTIYAVSKAKNIPSTDITITIQGDEHVAEGKNVTFTVAKDSKWETVKSHEKIKAVKFANNYELDKWKQDNATGTDLADTYVFATDKTIYAVSKAKNVPSTDITITIQGDEHVAEGKNVTFKVAKDSKWETVKSHEKIKAVKFADNYELDVWKQDNATGTDLADTYVFATDKTIYAVSKTKVQQPKPEDIFEWDADEGEGFLKRKESFDKENLPETLVIPNKLNGQDVTMLVGGFANCTKIKMIDFSQCTALIAIGASAFESCTNLEGKITLPASLTTIQTNAFQGCAKITEVDFSACTALKSLAGFNECAGLTTVDLSKCTALKTIDSSAFSECTALKTVTFPVSLEKLENAFTECIELEIVDLSKCTSLKEIGFKTFYNCKKASIKLPDITRLKLTDKSFGEITGGGEDKLCKEILTAKGDKGDALKELIKRKAKYPEERIGTYE